VIEDRDAAEIPDLAEASGELDVLARGSWIARGVVVAKDDRRRCGSDEWSEHVARMNLDAGEAAPGKHGVEENAVSNVEGDGPKLFDGTALEAGSHVHPDLAGAGEPMAANRALAGGELAKFESAAKAGRLARGEACGDELGVRSRDQAGEVTDGGEETTSAGWTDVEDVGEQLDGARVEV
jgi:hypothetical protein